MVKKDQSPEKILRVAAAKAKEKKAADERNKAGALIRTLDTPEGQYTKEITCVDCGAKRKVKPQDAWQVKRCIPCREKQKTAGLKAFVSRKTDPVAVKAERVDRRLEKLDAWVKRADDEVLGGFKRMHEYQTARAAEPKLRRIWP